MTTRLNETVDYREALGALFSAAMNPGSEVSILGESAAEMRDRARHSQGQYYPGGVGAVFGGRARRHEPDGGLQSLAGNPALCEPL